MKSRGMKQFAVMAMNRRWSKPRFVWGGQRKRMEIYDSKKHAEARAKEMSDPKQPGGKMLLQMGWEDRSHNTPILAEVDWIVVPIWTETMP